MRKLDDSNFLMYAIQSYKENFRADLLDFKEDLDHFKYLKKLFSRYKKTGKLNERLILNHIVVLYNIFDTEACTRMLTFKLYHYLPQLFPFLKLMGLLPEVIYNIGFLNETIITEEVFLDESVTISLEKI